MNASITTAEPGEQMKKLLILVALAAMIVPFLFVGCSSEVNTYADSEVINANVNEEFVIALDSNPTTGYSWQESYNQSFLKLVDKKYEQSPGSEGTVGSGGTEYFRFKALKAGETKITIGYSRPWESKPPAEMKVFTIKIK